MSAPRHHVVREILGRWGYLPLLYIVFLAITWRSFLGTSLWLDEAISAWVAGGSTAEVFARAASFQPQGPLYFLLLSWWETVAGTSEIALRLFSFGALAGATVILFLLARRLGGAEFASIAVGLFVTFDGVLRSYSARPYALALFLAFLSTYALVRWCQEGRTRWQFVHALALIACAYTHILFLVVAVPQVAALVILGRTRSRHAIALSVGGIGLALAPLVSTALALQRGAGLFVVTAPPSWDELLRVVVPTPLVIYVVFPIIVALLVVRGSRVQLGEHSLVTLFAIWFVVGPLIFFLYSRVVSPLFIDRYFLWAYGGGALVGASAVASIRPWRARAIGVVIMALLMTVRESGRTWVAEEWREAAEVVQTLRGGAPVTVLYFSGLVEGENENFIGDARNREYLLSPLRYYGVHDPVVIVPSHLEGRERAGMRETVSHELLDRSERILFIGIRHRVGATGQTTDEYYRNLLGFSGFSVREIGGLSKVRVLEATRKPVDLRAVPSLR